MNQEQILNQVDQAFSNYVASGEELRSPGKLALCLASFLCTGNINSFTRSQGLRDSMIACAQNGDFRSLTMFFRKEVLRYNLKRNFSITVCSYARPLPSYEVEQSLDFIAKKTAELPMSEVDRELFTPINGSLPAGCLEICKSYVDDHYIHPFGNAIDTVFEVSGEKGQRAAMIASRIDQLYDPYISFPQATK